MNTAVEYFDKTAKKNPDTPKNVSEAKTKLLYGGVGLKGQRDKKKGESNTIKESAKGAGIGAGIGALGAGLISVATKRKINMKTLKSAAKGAAVVGGAGGAVTALNYQGGRHYRPNEDNFDNLAKKYLKEQKAKK